MKGPRSRHRFNVKRIWECQTCQKRVFEPPQVASRRCACQAWMRLIEEPPPYRRKPANEPEAPAREEA